MAETMPDVAGLTRAEVYDTLDRTLPAVLGDEPEVVSRMATAACLLHHALENLWSGFYRVVAPNLLKVGPYQGTLGCLEIAFGRGVCGTAAAERRTVVVPDVHAFPGHITCDGRSRSEIVVPVFDRRGALVAVLDLDSDQLDFYGDLDRERLERLMRLVAP